MREDHRSIRCIPLFYAVASPAFAAAAFLSVVPLIASSVSLALTVVLSKDPMPLSPQRESIVLSSSQPEVGVVSILSPCNTFTVSESREREGGDER